MDDDGPNDDDADAEGHEVEKEDEFEKASLRNK